MRGKWGQVVIGMVMIRMVIMMVNLPPPPALWTSSYWLMVAIKKYGVSICRCMGLSKTIEPSLMMMMGVVMVRVVAVVVMVVVVMDIALKFLCY